MGKIADLGLLSADQYIARRSPSFGKGADVRLSEKQELDWYLSTLEPNYLSELQALSSDKPLGKDVRVIATLVAYGEGERIRATLNNYLQQDLPSEQFELIVFDNHPESVARDNTQQEVEKFQSENPHISLVYAHKAWGSKDFATVGNARKHVFDIALLRLQARGDAGKETILISNDADTLKIDTNYFSSILEQFATHTEMEALVTRSVVPVEVVKKPNLYASLSLWDAFDAITCEGEPYYLRGVSSAFRTSIYCAVGGYNGQAQQAEDLEIGWMVADARGWRPNSVVKFSDTGCVQDPRRILMAAASRVTLYEMFVNFVSSPEIRSANNEALLTLIPDNLDFEMLEAEINGFWQWRKTGMYKWRGERFEADFQKAMAKLGIEFEILDDRVAVKSVDEFLKIFEADFERAVSVIHSQAPVWDDAVNQKIIDTFSSMSDGAIAARERVAQNIQAEIEKSSPSEELLQQYLRFHGAPYEA